MNEDTFAEYFLSVQREFDTGQATEHSYRPMLKSLIENLDKNISAVNEPKRQECGAPDFILTKKEVPIGYIEAKDVGTALDDVENSDQIKRYLESLDNLVLTDYLDFRFFVNGEKVDQVCVGTKEKNKIIFDHKEVERFQHLLTDFISYNGQTIKSASRLVKAMAGKARLMKDVITKALNSEEEESNLRSELQAFRNVLIHDMKEDEFADMYAQTIAYGLFAARLHDPTLDTFSRQEAAELLPKTNPFLRKLFNTVAGPDLDDRIVWIVDALADVFRAADVKKILESFHSESKRLDPFIHFYETFLSEFNPELRKSRGVWYTPEPVVQFIVRAIDDILKDEFNLEKGLADTSMTTVEVDAQMADGRYKDGKRRIEKEVHRVQILDPATGTGTFLAEIVRKIHSNFEGQEGIWDSYVNEHLLPRIHGFELLMAPYAMCHLKLDLLLTEFGYRQKKNTNERLGVYLTNSLEEAHPDTNTLFSSWLSNEANAANKVKKETPVVVILGNPPYSGESKNKGDFIMGLMEAYKKEPGGIEKLRERNPKWINDDYVKFMRFSEYMIEQSGEGVLGFVTNHGYLDNPTFRGMRWHLLTTFDKIYIVDLHGNSQRNETAPDGGKDENVFDIKQGVSIILAIKNGRKTSELAEILHADFYGKRNEKYNDLMNNDIRSINWVTLNNQAPNYPFVRCDFQAMEKYEEGFYLNILFPINSVGIVTSRDAFVIDFDKEQLQVRIEEFLTLDPIIAKNKYNLRENKSWKIAQAQQHSYDSENIKQISYRPFDNRHIYYSPDFIERDRGSVMRNMLTGNNLALASARSNKSGRPDHFFVSSLITEAKFAERTTQSAIFPLYTYDDKSNQTSFGTNENQYRNPNLDQDIVSKIERSTGLRFSFDATTINDTEGDVFSPLDVFDYVYAILYSPSYRKKYVKFLSTNFPCIPYPDTAERFVELIKLGGELRNYHLLNHKASDKPKTEFPFSGSNTIEKSYPKFDAGKVYINKTQYFDKVPENTWDFHIGGYKPAQRWLKNRCGCRLTFDDILHWQKIIVALTNTERIMREIDDVWKPE